MESDSPIASELIVNADDFGFYRSVSRGIAACAREGTVTATGVMANGPRFDEIIPWLFDLPQLDVGAHLNFTYGRPISNSCLKKSLPVSEGFFSKGKTAALILLRGIPVSAVRDEWKAQLDRCLGAGLRIRFLNTHEHLHLLPPLGNILLDIAKEYDIAHVRFPRPEWAPLPRSIPALVRNLSFSVLSVWNGSPDRKHAVSVLGVGDSGQLNLEKLTGLLSGLEKGRTYELMCHPGLFDPGEITDEKLRRFHEWEQERQLLVSQDFKDLLRRLGIRLQRFRALADHLPPGTTSIEE